MNRALGAPVQDDMEKLEHSLARRVLRRAFSVVTKGERAQPILDGEPVRDFERSGKPRRFVGRLHSMNLLNATDGARLRGSCTELELVDPRTLVAGADLPMEELAMALRRRRLTLPVWGTHLVQTVAGAINTGTHGSSLTHGALASDVVRVDLVDAEGGAHSLGADHPDFPFVVLGLGAFGCALRYALRVTGRLPVERTVVRRSLREWLADAPVPALPGARFDSRDAFVLPDLDCVIEVRRRQIDDDAPDAEFEHHHISTATDLFMEGTLFALPSPRRAALMARFLPLRTTRGDNIALQTQRWTTARADHGGHPVCEVAVDLPLLAPALTALLGALRPHFAHLWPFVQVRTQKADALPLSPAYRRDVAWIEFLAPSLCSPDRWARVKADAHAALRDFQYRSHLGKECPGGLRWAREQQPHLEEFEAIRRRYDPRGVLLNGHLRELLDPPSTAATGSSRLSLDRR